MRKLRQVVAGVLAICLITGCSKAPSDTLTLESILKNGGLTMPSWAEERIQSQTDEFESSEEKRSLVINTYYDNTQSMWGYGQMAGEAGRDGFRLFHLMTALRDTNKSWNIHHDYTANSYILAANSGSNLYWQKKSEDEIWSKYNKKDTYKEFYTGYSSAALPQVNGEKIGPLSLMFYGESAPFESDEINVIITDLAEQNQGAVTLATNLYSKVLGQGGSAVCIFAMRCSYQGTTYKSDENFQDTMVGTELDADSMPIYMILSGPDKELGNYVVDLLNGLKSQGEELNQQYWMAYYQPGQGYIDFRWNADISSFERLSTKYETLDPENIYVPELLTLDSSVEKRCDWEKSQFYTLYGLSEQDSRGRTGAAALLNTDTYQEVDGVHVFRYQKSKRDVGNTGYFALNYYIPLPDESVTLLYGYGNVKGSYNGVQFAYTSDRKNEELSRQEAESSSETTSTSRRRQKDKPEDASSKKTDEALGLQWVEDIYTEKNIDAQLHAEFQFVDVEDGYAYDQTTDEEIPKAKLAASEKRQGADYESAIILKKEDGTTLPDGKYLRLGLHGNIGTYPGSVEIFDFPIYIVRNMESQDNFKLPEWVADFSGSESDKSYRFDYICRQMFGGLDSKIDIENFEKSNAVLLTDIFTVITDLP